jgi:hypothetical protein
VAGTGATNTEETTILDTRLDRTAVYSLALFTVTPNDDGTGGTEVTGGSYARINISASSTDWNGASGGAPSTKTGPKSGVTWQFPQATANWGTVTAAAIYESTTMRYICPLTASITVNSGDTVQFDSTHQITAQLGDPTDTF